MVITFLQALILMNNASAVVLPSGTVVYPAVDTGDDYLTPSVTFAESDEVEWCIDEEDVLVTEVDGSVISITYEHKGVTEKAAIMLLFPHNDLTELL